MLQPPTSFLPDDRRPVLGILLALFALTSMPAAASTILTFEVAGGAVNFEPVPEAYGDSVAGSPQAGDAYGFLDDGLGWTPDVLASYGAPGELPRLFTTGYGDLTDVYFNDFDSDTSLTLTLSAEPGYRAVLRAFDLASFSALGQTLPGLRVLDGGGTVLYAQGETFVPGSLSGGHTTLDLAAEQIVATTLVLQLDLTGLGMQSDNIGLDNLVFAQALVPEPTTAVLLGLGLLLYSARGRSREAR